MARVSPWAAQYVDDEPETIEAEPFDREERVWAYAPKRASVPWSLIIPLIACSALGLLSPWFLLAAGCFALSLAARR